jgi:hypothetical protein
MHGHLFRSKTRILGKKLVSAFVCIGLCIPVPAFSDAESDRRDQQRRKDDRQEFADREANADRRELERRRDAARIADAQANQARQAQIAALREEAKKKRELALDILNDPAKSPTQAAEMAIQRRRATFELDPKVAAAPVATPEKSAPKDSSQPPVEGAAAAAVVTAANESTDPASLRDSNAPQPQPASPGSSFNYGILNNQNGVSRAMEHIRGTRIPFLTGYGVLAARIRGDQNSPRGIAAGGPGNVPVSGGQFPGVLRNDTTTIGEGTNAINRASFSFRDGGAEDYVTVLKKYTAGFGLDPQGLNVAKLHLKDDSNLMTTFNSLGGANRVNVVEDTTAASGHGGLIAEAKPTSGTTPTGPTGQVTLDGVFANDVEQSVKASTAVLREVMDLLNESRNLAQRAAEEASKPPQNTQPSGSGGGSPNSGQGQQAGTGGGGGGSPGGGNGDKGGGGGSGAEVPQPGPVGDARGLLEAAGNTPTTPDVSAVAAASQTEQQPFPKFGGLEGGVMQPGAILKPTQQAAVAQTSAPVTVPGGRDWIQGNMSPASGIDPSFFGPKNGGGEGGGGGGGATPASGGGLSGGTANGFGGDDVGRGIGPSFGGRAGLNDPVKKYEAGPGGGSVQSESNPTIGTGVEPSIPQNLQGQVGGGKKFKDGGKEGRGLMGHVYSLIQTQCADQTQRTKLGEFCPNASTVATRYSGKKDEAVAYSPTDPRRDLASERGVTSSK